MALEGWYYLHDNGSLIYKGAAYTSTTDFYESDLVRAFWPVELDDREKAWNMLVEATAAGANPEDVRKLVDQWGCDDEDAQEYAGRVNVVLRMDGDQWCATREDFVDLQQSPAGFGATCLEAMADLAKALGYRASKRRTPGFGQLASGPAPIPEKCPTCSSSAPHLHPAVQHEGEVQPCRDRFHAIVTPQNTPERISASEALLDRASS